MGIFDDQAGAAELFTTYRAVLVFRDKLMGGIPKNPAVIEGWLRSKTMVTQGEEIKQMMFRTLLELGADVTAEMTFEELEAASAGLAAVKNTNGFKQDSDGLYLEARNVKAMLKEVTNALYAGQPWVIPGSVRPRRGRGKEDGQTAGIYKGAKSFVAERVFIEPDRIHFGKAEPDGVDLFVGHVQGPAGRTSNVTYYEYMERPTLTFDVLVAEDGVPPEAWGRLWYMAQENGLGALRSQGHGQFDITHWDKLPIPDVWEKAHAAAMDGVGAPA